MHVVFFSYVDLSGSSGENVFSRELIAAIARQPGVRLSVITPEPKDPIPDAVGAPLKNYFFLPSKRSGDITWHLSIQRTTASLLRSAVKQYGQPEGFVTTLRTSTIAAPILSFTTGTPQVLVVEGLESKNVSRMTSIPGAGAVMSSVAWLNALRSRQVLAAYAAIEEWIGRLPFVDRAKIEIFSHGVDVSAFPQRGIECTRRDLGIPFGSQDFVVGFVGSYKWYHSLDILVRALARPELRDMKCILVGTGPQQDEIDRLIAELCLADRVLQTGAVPHSEISKYIGACDVMYGARAPEHWSNPIKLIEYLAAGRAVVGYRTAEVAFIEEEGVGILLDEVTAVSVAATLLKFQSLGRSRLEQMGGKARKLVIETRTWDCLASRIIGIFE